MFGLWYFSLAVEEIRKRFDFINRIFIFFTGNDISSNAPALPDAPADEPCAEQNETPQVDPEPVKPTNGLAAKPSGVEDLPKPVEEPPKPVQVPVQPKVEAPLKPAEPTPVKPEAKPETKPIEVPKPIVEPAKPKVEVPLPAVVTKPDPVIPKEQPKPAVPAPKIPEPATNGHQPKTPAAEPAAKPAAEPPTPQPLKPTLAEDGPLAASAAAAKAAVELPASNEDSFIIVEQQKPKPAAANPAPAAPTPASVRNSTMDFLRAEGGRGAPAPPTGQAAPATIR